MTLTVNLPDEKEALLNARAQAQGLSPQEFAGQVVAHALGESAAEPYGKQQELRRVNPLR